MVFTNVVPREKGSEELHQINKASKNANNRLQQQFPDCSQSKNDDVLRSGVVVEEAGTTLARFGEQLQELAGCAKL